MSITEAKTRLQVLITMLDRLEADKRFKMAIDVAIKSLEEDEMRWQGKSE